MDEIRLQAHTSLIIALAQALGRRDPGLLQEVRTTLAGQIPGTEGARFHGLEAAVALIDAVS